MNKSAATFLANYTEDNVVPFTRSMPVDCVKRVKKIWDKFTEVKASLPPETEDTTIRSGGISGVGATLAGNGTITRYTLDRAIISREITITVEDGDQLKVSADGNYRMAEPGEGTDGWDGQRDMTPAGEWKNEKTGGLVRPLVMVGETVITNEAISVDDALKYAGKIKAGSCEAAVKSGRGNRYEYDVKEMEVVDEIIARHWNE